MEEIQGGEGGRGAERAAWWLGMDAWLGELRDVQDIKPKSRRILRCVCCRRGGKNGKLPERQKGLWK